MPSTDQAGLVGGQDQITAFAGRGAKLDDSSTIAPVFGHFEAQRQPRVGRVLLDLPDLFQVVEGDQRLVLVELLKGLGGPSSDWRR